MCECEVEGQMPNICESQEGASVRERKAPNTAIRPSESIPSHDTINAQQVTDHKTMVQNCGRKVHANSGGTSTNTAELTSR